MSRQGGWARAWTEFLASFTRAPTKHYVGEDHFGNRFYEYSRGQRNVTRGWEPSSGVNNPPAPPLEWQAWAKLSRRFPPSNEEIRLNMLRQQNQLAKDSETEKRAPKIESHGIGAADMDRKQNKYPTYSEEDFEPHPGSKKQADSQLELEDMGDIWMKKGRRGKT